MPYLKKTIPVIILFILFAGKIYGTHVIGGEITYKCLGNNLYEITVKVYRDCYNGIPPFDNPAHFTIFDGSNQVYDTMSIALTDSSRLPVVITNPCLVVPPNVCVEVGTYVFYATLPHSPGGYTIAYQRCCRNISILNVIDPSNTGSTYVATISDAALADCDNSPVFGNYPPIAICANFPLIVDHKAFDLDGDSLVYYLCQPLNGTATSSPQPVIAEPPPYLGVEYVFPYNATDPMNGSPKLSIDSKTGLLTVTPTMVGQFLVGICADEYRNGVFMGEHHRDFQFNVVDCHPSVVASIPGSVRNCKSNSISFQNFSTGATQYHWDFGVLGITTDTSNLQFPVFSFPDTGTFKVRLKVFEHNKCSDSAEATVYIYPTLTPGMVVNDGCAGKPISFKDVSTSSAGIISVRRWSLGDNTFSTLQNLSHVYNQPKEYTVSLVVNTSRGCADSVSKVITIHPTPVVTAAPDDSIICANDSVQLYGDVQGGGIDWTWAPDYNISSLSVQNPVISPHTDTTYYLTAVNTFGCIGRDSVTISYYDSIYADAGVDTMICIGDAINLRGSVFSAHYNWTLIPTLQPPSSLRPTASPLSTTTYVLYTATGSCRKTDSVTVTVKPRPEIEAGPEQNICFGDTSSISASGCTSYSWFPPASLSHPQHFFSVAYPQETTIYYVTGRDSTKCPISVTDSQAVVVHHPELTYMKNDTTIIYSTSAAIWARWGVWFQWYPAELIDNPFSSDPVVSPTVTTTYHVNSVDSWGCRAEDSVIVNVVYDPIVIIPNAFSPNGDDRNDTYFPIVIGLINNVEFRIYNRWGQLVYLTNDPDKGWDGTYQGKPLDIDAYVYVFSGTSTMTGKRFFKKGNVSLLR